MTPLGSLTRKNLNYRMPAPPCPAPELRVSGRVGYWPEKLEVKIGMHNFFLKLDTVSRYVIRTDKLIWPPRIMHFRNLLDIEKLKKHLKSWFTGTTFLSLITNQLEFNLFSSFQISVCFFSHWQTKVLRAFCLFWSAISWCWVIIQARLILSTQHYWE